MIKRLRKKFILITMVSVASVMLLLSLIVNIANYISVDSGLTQMLRMISDNQGKVPSAPPDIKSGEKPEKQFNIEAPYSTRYFVLRYTEDGELIQADLKNIAAVTEDDTGKYLEIAQKHGEGFGYVKGYRYYVVRHDSDKYMAIFLDCNNEMQSVATFAAYSAIATVICTALVYILVLIFSRKAIDPVVKASEKQKQFITDAGHELKTPITVIATSLKVLEMETGKQKWIDKAMSQTEKLKDLVNSLVTLSKMDEDASPLTFAEFNISDAMTETAESFKDFALSQGHELNIYITPEIIYRGDEYALRQLASTLIDNAVKYADEGTPISFSLDKTKKGVVIKTSNKCENIEKEDLDKLFDRFYRPDKSRNSGTGGFGIGLSIVRSIAEGHKGTAIAKAENDHTIEFIIQLR